MSKYVDCNLNGNYLSIPIGIYRKWVQNTNQIKVNLFYEHLQHLIIKLYYPITSKFFLFLSLYLYFMQILIILYINFTTGINIYKYLIL